MKRAVKYEVKIDLLGIGELLMPTDHEILDAQLVGERKLLIGALIGSHSIEMPVKIRCYETGENFQRDHLRHITTIWFTGPDGVKAVHIFEETGIVTA